MVKTAMNPTSKQTLKSFEDVSSFIDALAEAGLLFHFDDEPADCLRAHDLTDEQIEAIKHNVAQLSEVDWSAAGYECPFDYILRNH